VLQALQDENKNVREAAAKTLVQVGERLVTQPQIVAGLLQAMKDKEWSVQYGVENALKKIDATLANNSETINVVLQALQDENNGIQEIAAKILSQMGSALANYPQALLAVLRLGTQGTQNSSRNYEQQRQIHWVVWLKAAVKSYLKIETPSAQDSYEQLIPIENSWLPVIVQNLSINELPSAAGWIMDQRQLMIWSGNYSQVIPSSSEETIPLEKIKPLIEALTQSYAKYGLPLPDYAACDGERLLYPQAKKPLFRATQFSTPPALVQKNQGKSTPPEPSTENEKLSRSQQLRKRLKPVSPATRVFISYAWELGGSQQLKFLQEHFLRDTLRYDLTLAGLSPWLDTQQISGDMDRQMCENIAQSHFVIMMGTQLYAKRSKLVDCQLLRLHSFSLSHDPQKLRDDLQKLSLTTNTAYIRAGNQLFYANDIYENDTNGKAKGQSVLLQYLTPQELQAFDQVTQVNTLPFDRPKNLSKEVLSQITLATNHSHTNVRKELEFILSKAKREETHRDFLLPLLLEGGFNNTFGEMNEVNQKFLLHTCHSWFSIPEARWQSYKNYILALTQTSSLGILPTLLGFSSLSPGDKVYCDYTQRAEHLKLQLDKLEEEKQPSTAMMDLKHRLLQAKNLFESQRNLLHNFLRDVAKLTGRQSPSLSTLPSVDHNYLPLPSVSSDSSISTTTPSGNTTTNGSTTTTPPPSSSSVLPTTTTTVKPTIAPAKDSASPSTQNSKVTPLPTIVTGRYAFFPSQKPSAIQETRQSEENQTALRRELQKLIRNNRYKFCLTRIDSLGKQDSELEALADHSLVVQLTNRKGVFGSDDAIRRKLEAFGDVLLEFIESRGDVEFQPRWFNPDWENWTLTIYANTNHDIDSIAWLLQTVGEGYIRQEQDQSVTCALQ